MGLNTAGITALMEDGADAVLWVAIGDGDTAADEISDQRRQIIWGAAAIGELEAANVPLSFTGPAGYLDGTHMLFFSAASGGTFYGSELIEGSTEFSASGAFQVTVLTLAAAPVDPESPPVPDGPFALGSEVGVPTGTSLADRSSLGSPTATETFEIVHPVTGDVAVLDVQVWRGIRFTSTITPTPGPGESYLFENCSFEGQGNWCVEVGNANGRQDVMDPLVVFNRCSFSGGDVTGRCLLGGYAWVIDSDMRESEDGWQGWYWCVGLRSNFVGGDDGGGIDAHSDGVQATDTGRGLFYQCWISSGILPGASQAYRVGTEAGAAQDCEVYYCGLDGGNWTMQFRGEHVGNGISGVHVQGCRWTRNHESGPIDVVDVIGSRVWRDNAYFDGEAIPAPAGWTT